MPMYLCTPYYFRNCGYRCLAQQIFYLFIYYIRHVGVILHRVRLCSYVRLCSFKVNLTNVILTACKDNSQNCDIVIVNNDYLMEHLIIHTWENSYQCSECDKIFLIDSILTSHLQVLNVCFISILSTHQIESLSVQSL